jgi:hypothetical protein
MVFPNSNSYPRRWADMSPDFKAFFLLHGGMMAMFVFGGALTVSIELGIEAVLLAIVATIAVIARRKVGWRWAGCGPKDIGGAVLTAALMVFFAGAGWHLAPITDPHILPWYIGVGNIGLFNVLTSLRIARLSKAEFLADQAGQAPASQDVAADGASSGWKKIASVTYQIAFLAVWVAMVCFFYAFDNGMHVGLSAPTLLQSEPLTDHGRVVYVSSSQIALIHDLELASFIGIPVMMATGALLQFGFGVKVFGNLQTRLGRRQ